MKRSEMVQTIVDYLHLLETEDINHSKEDQAEYILGTVETFGMLPSSYKCHHSGEMYDLKEALDEMYQIGIEPMWEEEDE